MIVNIVWKLISSLIDTEKFIRYFPKSKNHTVLNHFD